MSATINKNKMKFSVFGKGFEDSLGNSGDGGKTDLRVFSGSTEYAVIDSTGTYFWTAQNAGGWLPESCNKWRLDTLENVPQTAVTNITGKSTCIFHPSNVANDYGIVFQYGDSGYNVYLFNLTDDTLYGTATIPTFYFKNYDCILVGDYIYLIAKAFSRTGLTIYSLNVNTMAFNESAWLNNVCSGGFIDNDTANVFLVPVWFSDYKWIRGCGRDMSTQWDVTANDQGSAGFPYINQAGLCGNGNLYLPTYKYGAWRFGVYSGNGVSDFTTPKPIRTFGNFGNTMDFSVYSVPVYDEGRLHSAFTVNGELYVTNFDECQKVDSTEWLPVAMNDHYIIAHDFYNTSSRIFKYR